jgi:hypothetical protein
MVTTPAWRSGDESSMRLGSFGASLSSSGAGLDPLLLTGRGISISVGSRADFEDMNRAIAMHDLHPAIYRTFPFAEAKDTYAISKAAAMLARS